MTEDELCAFLEENYDPHNIVTLFDLTTSDLLYYCWEKVERSLASKDIILTEEESLD